MREEGLLRRQFTFANTPAQVLVQLIGQTAELVVAREIYRGKGERRGSTNHIYAYDCTKGVLRYVSPDDDRVLRRGLQEGASAAPFQIQGAGRNEP
jgi:hypothetical protein